MTETSELERGNALVTALAKAQADFPPIDKNKTATVRMAESKGGGQYSYKYADIADVLTAVRPILTDNGLALIQRTEHRDGKLYLLTELRHVEGGVLSSEVELLADTGVPQQFGGSLTYVRRYELVTLLGIAAEEDRDAQDVEPIRRGNGNRNGNQAPPQLPDYALDTTDERRAELVTALVELGLEREPAARLLKAATDRWQVVPNGVVTFVKWAALSTPDAIAKREAAAAAETAEGGDPPADESDEEAALRAEAETAGKGQGAGAEPAAPGSRQAPNLEGANLDDPNDRDQVERLLKNLGCSCRDPLAALDVERKAKTLEDLDEDAIDDACPIAGHGHPF